MEDSSQYINLFVLYDNLNKTFFLCGKKVLHSTPDTVPFSFYCENEKNIKQFADLILDDRVNVHLYNFNDLPSTCIEITFDTLNEMRSEDCKIVTYYEDHEYYNNFITYLEILKNVKNDYVA
jgi:hypothetical protein